MHESLSAPRKRFYLTRILCLHSLTAIKKVDVWTTLLTVLLSSNSTWSSFFFLWNLGGKLSPVLVWALLFPLLLLLSALRKLLGVCLATQYPGNGEGGQDSYSRAVVLEPGSKLTRQIKSFPAHRGPLPPTFSLCKILFSRFVVATQVKSRRWGDICGTEGEEIPSPKKDSCRELAMDIIGVKTGGEGGVTVMLAKVSLRISDAGADSVNNDNSAHLFCAECVSYFTQDVPFIPPNNSSR